MKTFTCHRCKVYLGEMEKGKIKNGVRIFCTECSSAIESLESLESLKNYEKSTGDGNKTDGNFFDDFLKGGLFKK